MAVLLPSRQVLLSELRPISVAQILDSTIGDATCIICFGDLADNAKPGESERAIRLHGTHFFGEQCIRRWLEENDSCPHCRRKVHAGAGKNQRNIVASLTTQTRFMVRRTPSTLSPITDSDMFKLFGRLAKGILAINSTSLRAELRHRTSALLLWRVVWWEHNPAFVQLGEYAPYTRTEILRVEDVNARIVVCAEQVHSLVKHAVNEGYIHGLVNAMRGLPLHVGAHPLSYGFTRAIRQQFERDEGKRMIVSTFAVRLRDALEQNHMTRGLMKREREDLPSGLKVFCEDVIVRIVRELIVRE